MDVLNTCSSFLIAVIIMFDQSTYSVNEDDGSVLIVLVLSKPSLTDITVDMFNTDETATGEYYSILIKY